MSITSLISCFLIQFVRNVRMLQKRGHLSLSDKSMPLEAFAIRIMPHTSI